MPFPITELHTPCPTLLDLACKLGAKPVPPVPNGFIAYVHATFMKKIFYIPQWKWKSHIKHKCKLDYLWTCFEVAECSGNFGLRGLFWQDPGQGAVRQTSPSISIHMTVIFYEITKERHSVRAASRLILKVVRFESDLWELNRLWSEAWIDANFCRLCIRLNRSMALSRRLKGKCEFSALLFAHRLVTCFSEQPSSFAAAL